MEPNVLRFGAVLSLFFLVGSQLASAPGHSVPAPNGDISELFGHLSGKGDAYDPDLYDQVVLLGDEAVPYLRSQLKDTVDPWLAASLLGTIATPSARAALREGVRTGGSQIARLHCIYALGHLRDTAAAASANFYYEGPLWPGTGVRG